MRAHKGEFAELAIGLGFGGAYVLISFCAPLENGDGASLLT
jgi:hypothetical protein